MPLARTYDPKLVESSLQEYWKTHRVYDFDPQGDGEIFSIDTPPPTVSGFLHLGHVYSYSHTDFIARFRRMLGQRVFYPMGFDDNGLPTERFVEKLRNVRSTDMSRQAFIDQCLQVGELAEKEYQSLWQRLGLSIDWRYTYRTIDETSRRISQWSFIDLYRKGYAYHRRAPGIWCPECRASFAQADLNDATRESELITLEFASDQGEALPIATTRPELLAACVAVFVHPSDARYAERVGQHARVPFYGQWVPILADPAVDPLKGTGAVMCCTFGDAVDVAWWYAYSLKCIELISEDGRLLDPAGPLSGMRVEAARDRMKEILAENSHILAHQATSQTLRVHERCDSPVEYRMSSQWFVNILEHKQELIDLGNQLNWYPATMKARYQSWVENLNWDWCLSRQRYFGVPFPVWYCQNCGETILADEAELPVAPLEDRPKEKCPACGGDEFRPETDLMDTWATSSMSPQIVGQWIQNPALYEQVYPFALRPQAHDIIRTWVFYTIVKSFLHFGRLPWQNVAISGWGIAGEGMGKISKSRGGGPLPPLEMIERYSADAVRYWAASTGPGKDAVISEEKILGGQKLATKLWNVARFSERFLTENSTGNSASQIVFSSADRWILARLQHIIARVTDLLQAYDYAAAKSDVEAFFWHDLADNYLEMCKQRLYDPSAKTHSGAVFTLRETLLSLLKLLAPFLPYITEQIYLELFQQTEGVFSIHRSGWPKPNPIFARAEDQDFGSHLVAIAGAVRRYKSQHNLPLGQEFNQLQLATVNAGLGDRLRNALDDLKSITRAGDIAVVIALDSELEPILEDEDLQASIRLKAKSTIEMDRSTSDQNLSEN